MATPPRSTLTIEPFLPDGPGAADALDGAAALLAERHRRHRLVEPALDPVFETAAGARAAIATALQADRASGVVARRDGAVVGYLIGQQKDPSTWGPNVWVEAARHAAAEPAIVRELYAAAAGTWVAQGLLSHTILVPASDDGLVDAWFRLDFGQQHVHAIREVPGPAFGFVPQSELVIRR